MIFDCIDNMCVYKGLPDPVVKGLNFLKQNLQDLQEGVYPVTSTAFATVFSYKTKPFAESLFESHRKYIDIQMVLSGRETIYFSDISILDVEQCYDEQKDCALYRNTTCDSFVVLREKLDFVIFFPEDGHAPGCQFDSLQSEFVKKIVVKVPVL